MTYFEKPVAMRRLALSVLLTHWLLLEWAVAVTCASEKACDAPSKPAATTSGALLQVTAFLGGSQPQAAPIEVCGVQNERCFDMKLDPAWVDGFEDLKGNEDAEPTFQSGEVQLVIARSGEDLTWLDALPQIPAVVYNRGGKDSLLPTKRSNLVIVEQENRGREDEVMLRHIVDHYDSLPDVTVFLQGWPFGHCPGLIKSVRHTISALRDTKKMSLLHGSIGSTDGMLPLSGTFWQYSMQEGQVGLASEFEKYFHHDHPMERARALYNKTCSTLLGGAPCPKLQWTAEGSQWAVSRDRIRFTPKHVYEGAIAIGEGWENKYRGLVMEALWPTLWGASSWEPKDVDFSKMKGYAHGRARARHNYCATDEGHRALVFSCHERMEFCENLRQAGVTKSKTFDKWRRDYEIHDGTDTEPWHVMAELEKVLWGAATWMPNASRKLFLPKITEKDGGLHLLQKGAAENALRWRITESHGNVVFARQTASGSWHYLGCDGNVATLKDTQVGWKRIPVLDGWLALQSSEDGLFLTLPVNESEARFRCIKKTNTASKYLRDATFLINALPRSEAASPVHS